VCDRNGAKVKHSDYGAKAQVRNFEPWSAVVLRIASYIMLTDSQAETAQLPAVKALSHVQHVPAVHANAPSLSACSVEL
jgi:hypothetical protein